MRRCGGVCCRAAAPRFQVPSPRPIANWENTSIDAGSWNLLAAATVRMRRLKRQNGLERLGCRLLVRTVDRDREHIVAPSVERHEAHHVRTIGRGIAAGNGNGTLAGAGDPSYFHDRASMQALSTLNGIGKRNQGDSSPPCNNKGGRRSADHLSIVANAVPHAAVS